MPCAKPSDCAPCSKCPDSAAPVMPRCDVALTDGSYSNTTIVVEDGCIVSVTQGMPLLYQPDNNCAPGGTGGAGEGGLQGPQGPPGTNATVQIGTVTALPSNALPTVVNVGTTTNAILNIGIPGGEDGAPGADAGGGADSTEAGIQLVNGLIVEPLPPMWPPVLGLSISPVVGTGVLLTATKNDANGLVTVELDVEGLILWVQNEVVGLQNQINTQQLTIDNHESRITVLEPP